MKKLIAVFTVVMFLALIGSAAAVDQKGKIGVGAYGGYAVGFGDFFKKWEFSDASSSQNKVNFSFGAKAKCGLTSNIALMAAVDYQAGKSECDSAGESESTNGHWIGILGNVQYVFMQEQKTHPYVTAGGGLYIPDEGDSKPGINAGVGVEHFFQDNLALDAGVRFHMVFFKSGDEDVVNDGDGGLSYSADNDDTVQSWDNATYLQIHVGVIYYFGRK
jgi:hypothetical protein